MFRELARIKRKLPMEECIEILKTEKRGILSVNGEDGYPYGMPMNHYYNEENGKIYFHCGNAGSRLEMLQKNDKVSFCVLDKGYKIPGKWPLHVKSVIIFGRIRILDDPDIIIDVTTKLSHKFTDDEHYIQTEIKNDLHRTLLLELTPENICGKAVTEA